METVWSIHGTLVLWMDQLQSLIKYCFPKSCRWVTYLKFGFNIDNRAAYLRQCLFCVSTQYIPLFLSIWSNEGNFPYIWERHSVLCAYWGYTLIEVCTGAPLSSRLLSRNTLLSRYNIRKMFCSGYTSERNSPRRTYQGYTVIYVCIGETLLQINVRDTTYT